MNTMLKYSLPIQVLVYAINTVHSQLYTGDLLETTSSDLISKLKTFPEVKRLYWDWDKHHNVQGSSVESKSLC